VPPERLQRFFIREGNTFRVSKHIRDAVVFAVQNLIADPPFSRLDLVRCRNLLIYLLIIADYRLAEGETGIEAIRHIRQSLEQETPAVLVTGDKAPHARWSVPSRQYP
jgi:chemotaxis methyl-accepting protein methylase